MKPTIHLAGAIDARYLPHAATLLASLAAHHVSTMLSYNLLHTSSTPADKLEVLGQWWSKLGHELRLHPLDESRFAGLNTPSYFHPVVWGRIFLPEILADLDKVLYLDSDIVAADSLDELWAAELGDYYLAAVTNPFGPKSRAPRWPIDIGLPNMGSYFNSGVMLMNLAQMRRDMTIERIVVHGATPIERLPYPDQDALNLALRGRWLHLHPRWNMQNAILESEDYNNVFDPVALRESRITPALIHFEGPAFLKPWDVRCPHPFASLYRKHRRQTPWPYYIPDGMLQKCLLSLTPAMIRSRLRALKAH